MHTMRSPARSDLDARLLTVASRSDLLAVITDHDAPAAGTCPACGWRTGRGQKTCPSRVLARCVREHRPVPAWLLHLVDVVPGAFAPAPPVSKDELRAREDELPGLFDPLPRQIETTRNLKVDPS